MRRLCQTLCLTGLVILCCATSARAQPDGFHKMICRGGDEAFRIDEPGEVRSKKQLLVNFSPSSRAPGGDVWKLDAGTCSWADRLLADGEPQQVVLYVTPATAQRIREHLNSPDDFWQFFVRDTERGHYETRHHSQLIVARRRRGPRSEPEPERQR